MQSEMESAPSVNPDNASGGTLASRATNSHDSLIQLGEHSSFNFALAIAWFVAMLAVLATLYFWWLGKNAIDVVAEKQSKLDSIEQQIKAPAMVKAEKESSDFKSSVGVLSKAKKDRFSITEFLPNFYTKITNDVKISSLALSADGSLSIAGTTKSYRTTADLVMALKSWSSLTNVELSSVSMSAGGEKEGKLEATFSISAKVVKSPVTASSSIGSTAESTAEPIKATGSTVQPSTGGTE